MIIITSDQLTYDLKENHFFLKIQIGNNVYTSEQLNITMKKILQLTVKAITKHIKDVARGLAW